MRGWLAAAVIAFSMLACSNHEHTGGSSSSGAMTVSGPSIYALDVSLHDEHGKAIGLDVYRGHPVVVSMFYGSCPVACPLIVSHVLEVQSRLSPAARDDLRVLLVSFDPARDTPAALTAIAKERGLDLARWTLATGSDDDVRQVAAVLGVSYRAVPGGGFAHDSVITVLDRDGRPVARDDDPSADVGPLAIAVAASRR